MGLNIREQRAATIVQMIARFRKDEKLENAIVIVDDLDAMKLLIAWQGAAIQIDPPECDPPEGDVALWDWLWDCVAISYEDLADRAGLPEIVVRNKFPVMVSARLVYPDGTISAHATGVIQNYLGSKLKLKVKRDQS